ncbi:hypothetical protein COL01_06600 [Bacillus thuringiensis]|uniref:toll/interleukin-1 receptor domain-containing protein n=1 Tax=Bacillus thuringiensis TaxID=1428 RepID=UPI000BFA99DD|nr:toll/interleukin-1 receptor domain-containing protein [Bacillus thuringiensis]MCU4825544.1 toll/interleukin-1 receptor domain-containing protein [Bacillus cereus]MCU4855088.1 toll/interleukin-1 receptor domain-containing protein [Bacillus cereus]MCU4875211.1 toll/interleukin-1 receptor domain-containing protein [Bacillus cereus]PFV35996.1 hypothetical protein COL01_06600 [Bacillus thuringiensis]
MEKPKIFISHITEEKELANILKEEISTAFLGLPEIFVSSDSESISIGTRWLDEIDGALKNAQIILLLCSQNSVRRPWINFEAGAGWIKGIPVVPICHTNIKPSQLPIPLNMLQGVDVSNKNDLEQVLQLVGKQLGVSKVPDRPYEKIIESIKEFEKEYGVVQVVRAHVNSILNIEPQLKPIFGHNSLQRSASGYLSEIVIDKLRVHLNQLSEMGFISYGTGANRMTFASNGGSNELEFNIQIHDPYYAIASKIQ